MNETDFSGTPQELHTEEWKEILVNLEHGKLPEELAPITPIDDSFSILKAYPNNHMAFIFPLRIHEALQSHGMFGLISNSGSRYLANQFQNKSFIDPLAGRGWIANGLRRAGCTVYAGDIVEQPNSVTDVETIDGKELVKKYKKDADILLLSWPHDSDTVDFECAKEWGEDKLVICYGEIGITSFSERFLKYFHLEDNLVDFPDLKSQTLRKTKMITGYFKFTD